MAGGLHVYWTLLGILSGVYFWAGPLIGRGLSERVGQLHFWALFAGVNLTFLPMHMLGLAGMVIDGAIRDVAEIREREFPMYARGVNHRGPYKNGPGEINVTVSIGGMVVHPGDIIVGDQDGLLAFPASEAATLIEKALIQHHKEEQQMLEINQGRWDRSFLAALEAKVIN